MAEYGIPYMGSKDKICDELIKIFPKADNFYDLFGGGFSVTHAMLTRRSKDFKCFHFNEIRPGICDLVKRAIAGEFNYDRYLPPWVSREEFSDKLDSDVMIKLLWSFGNAGKSYLFSKEIEPYKKSMHNAVVFNNFDDLAKEVLGMDKFKDGFGVKDRRLYLRSKIEWYRLNKLPNVLLKYLSDKKIAELKTSASAVRQLEQLKQLEQLQQLERLERLQQLQQLERLQQLQQLEFYSTSYDMVPIKDNSIIYCDPPYADTAKYDSPFNHKKFFDWCHEQKNPVFISEYEIKDPRFIMVFKIKKRSLLSVDKSLKNKFEKVYVNHAGKKLLMDLRLGK